MVLRTILAFPNAGTRPAGSRDSAFDDGHQLRRPADERPRPGGGELSISVFHWPQSVMVRREPCHHAAHRIRAYRQALPRTLARKSWSEKPREKPCLSSWGVPSLLIWRTPTSPREGTT